MLRGVVPTYVLYADEAYTHNDSLPHRRFYGGCLLEARLREQYDRELSDLRLRLGLQGRVKWNKVRPFNIVRVREIVNLFLDWVENGTVKLRVMWLPQQIVEAQSEHFQEYGYYILYYFFVTYGFGLKFHDVGDVRIEFLPDTLPDGPEKRASFRRFLMQAHTSNRFADGSDFSIIRVSGVGEEHHMLLQCVDVIIGALGFILNDGHVVISGDGKNSEWTIQKENFARFIIDRLNGICIAQGREPYIINRDTRVGFDSEAAVPIKVNNWRFNYRQWLYRHN